MQQALARVAEELEARRKGYVCLTGVHGVMEAQRNPEMARVLANSALTVPDGMPTVWVGHYQGYLQMERVTGPDLMLEIIQRKEFRDYTHFFCGGKEGIAGELRDQLVARFPHVKIVGTYTPPFGPLSEEQERELIEQVDRLKPDMIWVGISTPKQELFMERYLPLLNTTLMFGVGAAFDFHTGRIADCAEWIKRCGLQWFHRLLQDPKHLWRRYLRNNPSFLFSITLQLLGLRSYPPQTHPRPHEVPQPAWVKSPPAR
ncbi:WecB/TagA/CpsF family glycosyltransferase [Granulicella mallensis]|nr:WecB/TagA/CpsF family glycosyltransferase [Granulicella mallensis]